MSKVKDLIKTALQSYRQMKSSDAASHLRNEKNDHILNQIASEGVYVVENFLSSEQVEAMRKEVERVFVEHKQFLWQDEEQSDHRIHGAQRGSELINTFNSHPFLQQFSDFFYGKPSISFSTLAAKLTATEKNSGSGGGWHRDTPYEKKQFKAIIYLTDVDDDNGPFQYVKGSQNEVSLYKNIIKYDIEYGQHRFSDDEVTKILTDSSFQLNTYKAKAGTLLMVNTFGIHRGMPIHKGERIALTNYYYVEAGFNHDFFEKKFNLIR